MSKAFFRYLRGELNGFYLQAIHNTINKYTSYIKDFFIAFNNQQFEIGKIGSDYLYGLGTFAGIFLPRMSNSESASSLRMTDSQIENGLEISERGLFLTREEQFQFFLDDGQDINNLATEKRKSSLVGDETVTGYISSSATDILDDNGNVRPEYVLSNPPEGEAYSEFYENKFLFLSEGAVSYSNLSSSLYIELMKAMQWIRYNGVSIVSLEKIIVIICPKGLIKIERIEVATNKVQLNIYYVYDDTVDVNLKAQRVTLLEFVVGQKFPQLKLVENT